MLVPSCRSRGRPRIPDVTRPCEQHCRSVPVRAGKSPSHCRLRPCRSGHPLRVPRLVHRVPVGWSDPHRFCRRSCLPTTPCPLLARERKAWRRRCVPGEGSCPNGQTRARPPRDGAETADAWAVSCFTEQCDPYWRAVLIENLLRLMRDRPRPELRRLTPPASDDSDDSDGSVRVTTFTATVRGAWPQQASTNWPCTAKTCSP